MTTRTLDPANIEEAGLLNDGRAAATNGADVGIEELRSGNEVPSCAPTTATTLRAGSGTG